ncbi:MAG: energy transducer TonB [Deltaproteobacteria bacterium]|nr:energy transducer TonB [Deltaproteobacteria bacterium]
MLAVSPSHITMLLLTALAMAGAGCKRTPRRDDPASRPVVSSPAAPVVSATPPTPVLAPPEPAAPAVMPPPAKLPLPLGPRPVPLVRKLPPPVDLDHLPPGAPPDDLEPIAVAGGVEAGVATGSGVAGGTVGSVGPMASDDRPRAMPVPAPDNATPAFPPDADPAITDARVTLRVSIGRDGSVTAVQALSGAAPFTTAALAAARSWQFQPATLAGSPVATTINMVVAFRR